MGGNGQPPCRNVPWKHPTGIPYRNRVHASHASRASRISRIPHATPSQPTHRTTNATPPQLLSKPLVPHHASRSSEQLAPHQLNRPSKPRVPQRLGQPTSHLFRTAPACPASNSYLFVLGVESAVGFVYFQLPLATIAVRHRIEHQTRGNRQRTTTRQRDRGEHGRNARH